MKTNAIILALSWITPFADALWNVPLDKDGSVLDHVLKNCRESGVIDDLCVVTDLPSLIGKHETLGVRIFECPEFYRGHPFNYLDIEQHVMYREFDLCLAAELQSDMIFQVSWNTPLISGRILERMYHKLLDDPIMARVVPIYPVDPHLYTKVSESGDFFPVWEHRSIDRQMYPQLYQVVPVVLTHWTRLLSTIPNIMGLTLDPASCCTLDTKEKLGLMRYLFEYKKRNSE